MGISRVITLCLSLSIGWGCANGGAQGESKGPLKASPSSAPEPSPEKRSPTSAQSSDPDRTAITPTESTPPTIAESPRPEPKPNPYIAPPVRTAGDLTVHAPPREPRDPSFVGRLRAHTEGSLSLGSARTWVGPQVPGFVVLLEDTMELFLLDRVGDEFMAFYREPYGAGTCDTGTDSVCRYFVRLYDIEGNEMWGVPLHDLLSAKAHLEVQDVRYADGTLYFNEACQSYSSEAKGKCSYLVAYDPKAKEVRWRTKNLVSNGRFLIHGDYIVAGYGFTAEKDFIYVVSRNDGSILQKVPLKKSPETFELTEDGLLRVQVYPGTLHWFEMRGWDTDRPKLVKVKRPRPSGRSTVTH